MARLKGRKVRYDGWGYYTHPREHQDTGHDAPTNRTGWRKALTNATGPLAGLRVLDLSMIVAGGTASSLMADFGAEVVKVERPGGGDPLRNWGPFANGVSLWW